MADHLIPIDTPTRIRAAALVITDRGILLVRHSKAGRDYWLLPGGGVEENEDPEQAVVREMAEETGLTATVQEQLFETESTAPDYSRRIIQKVYRCQVSGTLQPSQDARVTLVDFVSIEDFRKITFFPNIRNEIIIGWETGFPTETKRIVVSWEA